MSHIQRDEPGDVASLQALITSSRRAGLPVMFTDRNQCQARDFSCPGNPEVTVVDVTALEGSPEVKKAEAKRASTKRTGTGKVYPCDKYEAAPGPDDDSESTCCFCFKKTSPSEKQQKILEKLQKSAGSSVEIKVAQFSNWADTQQAVVFAAHPKSKEDIAKLIRAAKEHKIRVRSVGSQHSWSRIHADDNYLVLYMDQLQSDYSGGGKVRHADQGSGQADVMAGVTTGDFMDFQLENDVHLPANVILQTVTIVGVIATGCHGVGWDALTPGDSVTRMRIFDSDGNLRVYTNEDEEMMKAVSANFGTFGIIYDVTIQLVPNRKIQLQNKYMPFKSIMRNPDAFKELVEGNWSVELFWFPYNSRSFFDDYDPLEDEIFLRVINEDTSDEPVVGEDFYENQERLDYIGHEGLLATSSLYRTFPDLTPYLADAAFSILKSIYPPEVSPRQPLPHGVHYRKHIHLSPVRDIEFVFDLQNDYPKMIKIIQTVLDITTRYNKQGKYPLNIALEMRWMAYGESFLTPAIIGNPKYGGSGHVYYIEVLSVTDTPHWEEYTTDIAEQWLKMGGIPHLAKEWMYIPGIYGNFNKTMGKHFEDFKKQLKKSNADPTGIFMNSTLCKLFNMK